MERRKQFDFDAWSALARNDPSRFEARRRAVIDAFIDDQAPERQQRLRRLQWRVDRERERAPTALGACVRLSNLMWDRFAGCGGLADALNGLVRPQPSVSRPHTATVLPFRARR